MKRGLSIQRAFGVCVAVAGIAQISACAEVGFESPDDSDHMPTENVATHTEGLTIQTFYDNSVANISVQLKVCTTTSAASAQTADCMVDAGYALVGGGARANWTGFGALLSESRPLDDRTWRASSHDHLTADLHNLTVYALGLRLSGVNAQVLRNQIGQWSLGVPYNSLQSGGIFRMISGGGRASGASRYFVKSAPNGGAWGVVVKDHITPSAGGIALHLTNIQPGIIEGFGALDIQQRTGTTSTVSSGVASTISSVNSGFAVFGYGGEATWTSGPGRMLYAMGPNGTNIRQVRAQSKDHHTSSAGTAKVFWTEGRKLPGSHGLCNAGAPLTASMDACVADICAVDPFCCSNSWDTLCVSRVGSVCGKSCADHTCTLPSYTPAFWNTGSVQPFNNCYNYSTNRRTDTFAQPGRASGQHCTSSSCLNAATISEYATNDGLIPTTAAGVCPDNRDKLALVIAPGIDYHWYRRDAAGTWTHKPGGTAATNLDNSGNVITNPETANRGIYTVFAGYFCACSSSTEGSGKSVVN